MSDSVDGSRRLIDEEGRLFGVVNIIDLLVVLIFLAVVVAGAALVLPGGGTPDTRYVTINLGQEPEFVAERIEVGDEWEPEGTQDSLTITDIYQYNTGGETAVFVRGEVNGTVVEPDDPDASPVFEFRGSPLQLGQTVTLALTEYQVDGSITQIDTDDETLPVRASEFVVETTLSSNTVGEISVGDQFTAGGRSFGEITSLEAFPADGDQQYTLIGLRGQTINRGGNQFFANTSLSVGNSLTLNGDGYQLGGNILRRGTDQVSRRNSAVLVEATLPSETADSLSIGDEYRRNNETVGRINSLQLFPAGDDNRYALVGLELKTVERNDVTQFAGRQIRLGNQLTFESQEYIFTGQILRRNTSTIDTTERSLALQTEVPATVANEIQIGDEFQIGNTPVVSVEDLTVYPTGDVTTRRVILGVSAVVREESGTLRFGNRKVQLGSTLPLETSRYEITGEVIRRGSIEEPGNERTLTAVVQLDNVRPERAEIIRAGMREQSRSLTTAVIQNVSTESADIVLESESGDIFLRQHPKNRDVELEVDLTVRQLRDGTIRFRGEPLRAGQTVTFEIGETTIQGELIRFE